MKDIPVPVEALNDVLPGSSWQPEPAARYNALNALLRQEELPRSFDPAPSRGGEVLLPVRNITDELLPVGRAVEICPEPRPGTGIDFRRPVLFGRAVTEACFLWGIATENIPSGHGGLVQVVGPAVVRDVRGTPDRYVVPKPDGDLHFPAAGRAEVLYRSSAAAPDAVIYLGGGGSSGYTGMFAVTENEDATVTIGGGMAITTFGDGPRIVEEATLQKPSSSRLLLALLNARRSGGVWNLFFSIEEGMYGGYIPGEQICWPLAQLTSGGSPPRSFVQLWQGGVIDFSSRYYLG